MSYKYGRFTPNKTHGTVEKVPRFDASDIRSGGGSILLLNTTHIYEYSIIDDDIYFYDTSGLLAKTSIESMVNASGIHHFFVCSCCGKRFRYLYLVGKKLVCRKCGRLNYHSQQKFDDYLDYYRQGMQFAYERLKWECDYPVPFEFPEYTPPRPKGMHRTTYIRLMKKFRWYQQKYKNGMQEEFERIMQEISKGKYYE
ncbi:hypothetical protein [Butyrivibrio sp. AD3002]|uniref:hypothetical protein n=1 Tax=Butyrivibrio sp. AD3002 TaxID=1280670 RepID=UPI0003B3E41A|nr:hypothetical protein [Butyrivibrio sp. AD3002]